MKHPTLYSFPLGENDTEYVYEDDGFVIVDNNSQQHADTRTNSTTSNNNSQQHADTRTKSTTSKFSKDSNTPGAPKVFDLNDSVTTKECMNTTEQEEAKWRDIYGHDIYDKVNEYMGESKYVL